MRIRKHLSAVHLPAVVAPTFRIQTAAAAALRKQMLTAARVPDPDPDLVLRLRPAIGGHGDGSAGADAKAGEGDAGGDGQQLVREDTKVVAAGKRRGCFAEVCSSGTAATTTTTRPPLEEEEEERKNNNNSSSSGSTMLQLASGLQQQDSPPVSGSLPSRPKRTKPNPCLRSTATVAFPAENALQQQQLVRQDSCMQQPGRDGDRTEQQRSSPRQPNKAPAVAKDLVEAPAPPQRETLQAAAAAAAAAGANAADIVAISGAIVEERRSTRKARSRTATMRSVEEVDEEEEEEVSVGGQCRRMDGKGWRCHRMTQPDYSLCDYHLDKFRETNQRKLKNNVKAGTAAQEPSRRRTRVKRKPVKARSLMSI